MHRVLGCLLFRVCVLFSIFCVYPSKAFFERLTIWKMPNGQLIYGFGDLHGLQPGYEEVAYMRHEAHRSLFLSALGRLTCKPEDVLVIAEDVFCYRGNHATVKTLIEFRKSLGWGSEYREPPIVDIIQELDAKRFPVINAECRIVKLFGLSEPIRKIVEEACQQTLLPITAQHVVQEYDEAVQELQQYHEPMLQDYYRSALHSTDEFDVRDLEPLRHEQGDILRYIDTHILEQSRTDWKNKFLLFDCPLVDARIVHHIVNNSLKRKIIVLAGTAHIYRMGKILESVLSCRRIAHIGSDEPCEYASSKTYSRNGCLEAPDFKILEADDPVAVAGCSYS